MNYQGKNEEIINQNFLTISNHILLDVNKKKLEDYTDFITTLDAKIKYSEKWLPKVAGKLLKGQKVLKLFCKMSNFPCSTSTPLTPQHKYIKRLLD